MGPPTLWGLRLHGRPLAAAEHGSARLGRDKVPDTEQSSAFVSPSERWKTNRAKQGVCSFFLSVDLQGMADKGSLASKKGGKQCFLHGAMRFFVGLILAAVRSCLA